MKAGRPVLFATTNRPDGSDSISSLFAPFRQMVNRYATSWPLGSQSGPIPPVVVTTTLIAASTALPRGGVARFRTHGAGTNAARDAPLLRLSILANPYLL